MKGEVVRGAQTVCLLDTIGNITHHKVHVHLRRVNVGPDVGPAHRGKILCCVGEMTSSRRERLLCCALIADQHD